MRIIRAIAIITLSVLSLSVTACLDGREEVWIKPDGSGRAHFNYDVPVMAARFQGGIPGIESLLDGLIKEYPGASRAVVQEGERLKVEVKIPFSSPRQFQKIRDSVSTSSAPKSFRHLAGIFHVDMDFPTVDFTRTISPGKALPAVFIPASEIQGRKLTYIVHLPLVPEESTATRTENQGRTQIWETSLSAAMKKPLVIHFKAKIPVPTWVYAAGATVVVLVIWMGVWVVRRVSGKR